MLLIYVAGFLLLLYYLFTKNYSYWESRGVPYDKPFLIFGNLYKMVARKQHLSERIREIYANFKTPYVGMFFFNQPSLLVRSPEMLRRILVKDFDKFMNRKIASNEKIDPIAFHTLFSAQDQTWKNLRVKISPVFTSGKMKLMLPLIKECASDLVDYVKKREGEVIEVRDMTKKFAVDIISSCAFGINSYCLKNEESEIMEVATKLFDPKSFVRNVSVFSFLFAPKLVDIFRLTFVDRASSNYLLNVFNTTIKEREKKKIVRHDLIDLLNNLQEAETSNDSYTFNDIKMASQAILFFSAGNDTTSSTVAFTLYELALHKDIQDRLRQELRASFKKHGDFTYEGIQEMKYLDMVLNESLRKYPLTSFLSRKTGAKYTFEETGFTLDEDIPVVVPVAGLHYDPEFFPDPEKFDPERFNDENKHKIVPYTFLPFGDGPRNCIGQRFAILVSKIALAYSLKDFAFERCPATSVPFKFDAGNMFMTPKTGLHLRAVKVD